MEMKLNDVLNLNQTLKLIIDDSQIKLEPVLKFKLLSIMKSLENHVENFEIIRNQKIKEYGQKDEKNGSYYILPDDIEAVESYKKDIFPIIDSCVKADIDKIKADDIFNKGIKAEFLIDLYPVIKG